MANKFDIGGYKEITKVSPKTTSSKILNTQEIKLDDIAKVKIDRRIPNCFSLKQTTHVRIKKVAKANGMTASQLVDNIIRKTLGLKI